MYCNTAGVYFMYPSENVWVTCNDKVPCPSAMFYVKNAQSKNNKLLDFQNSFPLYFNKMIVMNLLIMNLARNKLQQQSSIVMDSYKVQTI